MRIGLDLTHCFQRQGGIQTYGLSLAQALIRVDKENHYVLFFRGEIDPAFTMARDVECVVAPGLNQVACEQVWVPLAAARAGVGLLHVTGFAGPALYGGRSIGTLCDLTVLHHPETMRTRQRLYWRAAVHVIAARRTRILTISEFVRKEASAMLGIDGRRVASIPLGVKPIFHREMASDDIETVRRLYRLPERYFLLVGTMEPRKNIGRIVRAVAELRKESSAPPSLVIVGRTGWKCGDVLRMLAEDSFAGWIHQLGSVPDEHLVAIYKSSVALVYVSLYEGFGLPILEAMASGCPVVTSSLAAMPEVAGDAAVYADPLDVDSILGALRRALSSEVREELRKRGIRRSMQFSWEETAKATLCEYQVCLA